jgi:uncharacterized protein
MSISRHKAGALIGAESAYSRLAINKERGRHFEVQASMQINKATAEVPQGTGLLVGLNLKPLMRLIGTHRVIWGARREKRRVMSLTAFRFATPAVIVGLAAALSVAPMRPCFAFDPNSGVSKDSGPFDLFKFGYKAYKSGQKSEALEAYRYAAEKGHTGSRWALANMYAGGDGVTRDDFEAFKMYSDIATNGIEPGSADTGYFVNALMALAHYYLNGIPGSPVKANLSEARQLYFQVASTFGIADAQFQLAKMILAGEGGKADVYEAMKWLNHARKKGHIGATALFGSLIYQRGETVRGLAYLTAALDHCQPGDKLWMQDLQEQAFAEANEDQRRKATEMAQTFEFASAN